MRAFLVTLTNPQFEALVQRALHNGFHMTEDTLDNRMDAVRFQIKAHASYHVHMAERAADARGGEDAKKTR